jgi:F-type H+-transporting ATPase subunit epsilon
MRIENNRVSLLTETAEWPEEIDLGRAEHAKEEAVHLLHEDKNDPKKAELKLKRALARIKAKH